jgi:NAD(P)-dependent dehydrogenase (short-subunit alcohol dehydrogenase family)
VSRLLEAKVAIVTGAGHGIGRGHALELAKHGASVVVNDLGSKVDGTGSGRDADETVRLITDRGGVAVANYGDVGDEQNTKELVDQAVEAFGRLDIVVNNAGIVRDRVVWKMTPEDFDLVMRVHLRSSWLMTHHAAVYWRSVAQMTEGPVRGRIINTTSGAGLVGNFGQSNYATAKAAIVGLTLTTSLELYSIGVTVNAIGPGGLTRLSSTIPGFDAPIEADQLGDDEYHAMDPAGSSPVVAWLSSDEAQHVTGQVVRVLRDRIYLMKGWTEAVEVSSGERRWDATKLGTLFATDIFKTRAPGLRV